MVLLVLQGFFLLNTREPVKTEWWQIHFYLDSCFIQFLTGPVLEEKLSVAPA